MPEAQTTTPKTISNTGTRRKQSLPSTLLWVDNAARRVLDVFISALAILLLSPFYFLIAFLIKRDSHGPVMYYGDRMGKDGQTFKILKFRTMYESDHSYRGPKVTAQDDPRITPIGRWLRDTKINELPQLWNILRGDMSLVGPRPEDPTIAATWPENVRSELLSVRPGLTSPASVIYRHEETLLQSKSVMDKYLVDILPSKLRLDFLYVRNRTVLTDLDVIFWTAVVMLPRLNNFSVPEYLLYWGPLSRFTARYLFWFVADLLASFAMIGVAGAIWRLSAPLDLGWNVAVPLALGIAALFSMVNQLMGLNRVDWNKTSIGGATDLAISTGVVTTALFMVNLLIPGEPFLPPSMLVVAGMLTFFMFVLMRYRGRLLSSIASRWMKLRTGRINVLGERVLIVGAGEVGQFANWLLRNGDLARAFSIVGFVDDDPRRLDLQIDGVRVIGTSDQLPALIEKFDVGLIMYAISNIDADDEERILRRCRSDNARLILVPDLLDSLRAHFPVGEMEKSDLFSRVLRNTTLDKLTGAYNQNHFLKLAGQEIPRARRYGHALSLVVFDVNTNPPGMMEISSVESQVLRDAAERCMKNIREIDLLGRISEHQFAALLPETELNFAHLVAERMRSAMVNSPVWTDRGPVNMDVSYGIAMDSRENLDAVDLIAAARAEIESAAQAGD